jgi:4-diphosphocytidyl-2-C-methyl-D-erythritol kinase
MSKISVISPAKINLMLHVNGKLDNGYHNLQSLFSFVSYGDELTIYPVKKKLLDSNKILTYTGKFANSLPQTEDNIIIKAISWLKNYYPDIPDFIINLKKNLPVAAGIGGGSSNAATIIAAIIKYAKIPIPNHPNFLKSSGVLGADVPVCLAHHLIAKNYFWIEGSGKEEFIPVEITDKFYYLLVNPNQPALTSQVFQANKKFMPYIQQPNFHNLRQFLQCTENSLKDAAIKICPLIAEILDYMNNFQQKICVRLSGSGATCFAMFTSLNDAKYSYQVMRKKFPNYWMIVTKTF